MKRLRSKEQTRWLEGMATVLTNPSFEKISNDPEPCQKWNVLRMLITQTAKNCFSSFCVLNNYNQKDQGKLPLK